MLCQISMKRPNTTILLLPLFHNLTFLNLLILRQHPPNSPHINDHFRGRPFGKPEPKRILHIKIII
jgi:hypothetical protein